MTHDQELLPCPFCGAEIEYGRANYAYHPFSETCPLSSFGVQEEQVRAWNTRPTPCPVTKEDAQAALEWVSMADTSLERDMPSESACKTIRALLERAAKGE